MKPAKLRFSLWSDAGWTPEVGLYLKAPRGRTAYEICAVRLVRRAGLGTPAVYSLLCERWNPNDVPAGRTIIPMYWDSRGKKK